MLYDGMPFDALRAAYLRRLIAASIFTALAAGSAHPLYAGSLSGEPWLIALIVCVAAGAAAAMMALDLMQRWAQIRQLRIVEESSKPYGFTKAATRNDAADDLGRRPRP